MASVEILDMVCYNKKSVSRRHRVYKTVWRPFMGEILAVNCEEDNSYDCHTVMVYLKDSVVGHLPRSISKVSWLFLMHGGDMYKL